MREHLALGRLKGTRRRRAGAESEYAACAARALFKLVLCLQLSQLCAECVLRVGYVMLGGDFRAGRRFAKLHLRQLVPNRNGAFDTARAPGVRPLKVLLLCLVMLMQTHSTV